MVSDINSTTIMLKCISCKLQNVPSFDFFFAILIDSPVTLLCYNARLNKKKKLVPWILNYFDYFWKLVVTIVGWENAYNQNTCSLVVVSEYITVLFEFITHFTDILLSTIIWRIMHSVECVVCMCVCMCDCVCVSVCENYMSCAIVKYYYLHFDF